MVARQGDVVWVALPSAHGSEPAGRRPAVVLQHDRFNRTNLATAVVVAIASQLKYAALPGNVRLRRGEAGPPCPSVVNVTQIATVDRGLLGARLGMLSSARLAEVWTGVRLLCEPDRLDEEETPAVLARARRERVGRMSIAHAGACQ